MFATVREAARASECVVEAATIPELIDSLKKRFGKEFARTVEQAERDPDRLVVLVNGVNAGIARRGCVTLRDGDDVALFPPVSGG
jgi:MoaD family protein